MVLVAVSWLACRWWNYQTLLSKQIYSTFKAEHNNC